MTIEVVNKDGKFSVFVQDPSAKKGTPAQEGVSLPCDNKEQAEALATELKKAEAEFKASGVDPNQVQSATLKPDEGKKLDVTQKAAA